MKRKTSSKTSTKASTAAPFEKVVKPKSFSKKILVLILALVLLAGLGTVAAKKYKSLFVVGRVNNQYVTRFELEKALNDRYAQTVFADLADVTLLKQLAKANNITVSKDELNKEISATEERLGGKEALQSTLDRLGYSKGRFEEEMRTQVIVRKLAQKQFKTEVTDEEIGKFYQDNKTLFPDQKLDDAKENIKKNLVEQKLQQQFTTWFQEQKTKAAIKSYL